MRFLPGFYIRAKLRYYLQLFNPPPIITAREEGKNRKGKEQLRLKNQYRRFNGIQDLYLL